MLLCSAVPLEGELSQTILARSDMERHEIGRFEEAVSMALALRPDLVVIHRRLPRLSELITTIRDDSLTAACPIVVLAEHGVDSSDLELLRSGVNAVLHLPAGPDWNLILERLLHVRQRREARFVVQFAVEGAAVGQSFTGHTVDLSVSGMLMQSPVALSIGDAMTFSIHLDETRVDGGGTVVRRADPDLYGVFFEQLQGDGHAQIERHLKNLVE